MNTTAKAVTELMDVAFRQYGGRGPSGARVLRGLTKDGEIRRKTDVVSGTHERSRMEIGFAANGKKTACSADYRTTGWQKTCKCDTDERVPCTVLDPFNGAGTTMLVAKRLGRRSIGLELNPEYIKIAEHRLEHWHRAQPPKIEPETANHGPLFDLMQEVAA